MVDSASSGSKPIGYTEDFRRAKRNVHFWAVVTSLAALAYTGPDHVFNFGPNYGGLAFPATLILLGAGLITAYMAIGYRIAEKRLLAEHNEFRVANKIEHAAEEADKLAERVTHAYDVSDISVTLSQVRSDADRIAQAIAKLESPGVELPGYPKTRREEALNRLAAVWSEAPHADSGVPVPDFEVLVDLFAKEANRVEESTRHLIAEEVGKLRQEGDQLDRHIRSAQSNGVHLVEQAVALPGELRNIAAAIGNEHKRVLRWYDRFPVWSTVTFAGVTLALRLAAPGALDAGVCRAFPAAAETSERCGPAPRTANEPTGG